MKKYFALMLVFVLAGASLAFVSSTDSPKGADGINFQHMTLADAMKLAKKEKKIIFIDVYTGWCGPCKSMAATTFKDAKVGERFNKAYVNLKLDAEKDADGIKVAQEYRVTGYPTFLFIDATGKLKKRLMGYMPAEQFLAASEGI